MAAILESEGGRGPSGFFTRAVLGTNFKIESVGDNTSFKRFLYTQCTLEALQNLAKQPRKDQERE